MRQHRSSTKSMDAHWSQRARRAAMNKPRGEVLELIAGPGCWCGLPMGHDWPKDRPHPRPVDVETVTPAQARVNLLLAVEAAGICPVCFMDQLVDCPACLTTRKFPPPRGPGMGQPAQPSFDPF